MVSYLLFLSLSLSLFLCIYLLQNLCSIVCLRQNYVNICVYHTLQCTQFYLLQISFVKRTCDMLYAIVAAPPELTRIDYLE